MCEVLQVKGVQGSASLLSTQCLCHMPSPLATAFQSLKSPGNERRLSSHPLRVDSESLPAPGREDLGLFTRGT